MTDQQPILVIYDGACGICEALRGAVQRRDSAGRLRFVPNQSADLATLAPGLSREDASRSVYVIHPDGTRQRGARAICAVLRALPGVWRITGRLGALPPVIWLAEPVYRVVAHHRARLSRWLRLTQCRIDPA